jgi:ABC-type multidrug transport system fused ATPase/permease subunit
VTGTLLPVADRRQTRRAATALLRRHRGPLAFVTAMHVLAALAALPGPALLGRIVDGLLHGTTAVAIDRTCLLLLAAVAARTAAAWLAGRSALTLAETVFAELRQGFLAAVTRLPLSVVERAGSGDLVARTTHDVDALSQSVRFAVPRLVVGALGIVTIGAAMVVTGPAISPAAMTGLVLIVPSTAWYLRRARDAYLRESAAHAALGGTVAETVDAARTVAALRLAGYRVARGEADLRRIWQAERYTLRLRTVWFPPSSSATPVPRWPCSRGAAGSSRTGRRASGRSPR